MTDAIEQMYRALKVIMLDKQISNFLEKQDPKALQQVEKAISDFDMQIMRFNHFSQLGR